MSGTVTFMPEVSWFWEVLERTVGDFSIPFLGRFICPYQEYRPNVVPFSFVSSQILATPTYSESICGRNIWYGHFYSINKQQLNFSKRFISPDQLFIWQVLYNVYLTESFSWVLIDSFSLRVLSNIHIYLKYVHDWIDFSFRTYNTVILCRSYVQTLLRATVFFFKYHIGLRHCHWKLEFLTHVLKIQLQRSLHIHFPQETNILYRK